MMRWRAASAAAAAAGPTRPACGPVPPAADRAPLFGGDVPLLCGHARCHPPGSASPPCRGPVGRSCGRRSVAIALSQSLPGRLELGALLAALGFERRERAFERIGRAVAVRGHRRRAPCWCDATRPVAHQRALLRPQLALQASELALLFAQLALFPHLRRARDRSAPGSRPMYLAVRAVVEERPLSSPRSRRTSSASFEEPEKTDVPSPSNSTIVPSRPSPTQ